MTTITVKYEIPEQLIRDIIITACEGGIGYWSQLETYNGPAIADGEGLPLRLREMDDHTGEYGEWRTLDIPQVVEGLRKMIQERPYSQVSHRFIGAIANYDSGNFDYDAGDADEVIQYALLGDLVYG